MRRGDPGRSLVFLVMISALVSGTGCTWIANTMAEGMLDRGIEKSVNIPRPNIPAVASCVARPGGACKKEALGGLAPLAAAPAELESISARMPSALRMELSPAESPAPAARGVSPAASMAGFTTARQLSNLAQSALENPTHDEFLKLFAKTRGAGGAGEPIAVNIDWKSLQEYGDAVALATETNAWDTLAATVNGAVTRSATLRANAEVRAYSRLVTFVSTYMRAYFRNGEFFEGTLDTTSIQTKIQEEIKKSLGVDVTIDAAVATRLAERLGNGLLRPGEKSPVFGSLGTTSFVARGGVSYQFPGLQATLDPLAKKPLTFSKIDATAIGVDMVRVAIEASFDSANLLPAVSNATGVGIAARSDDPSLAYLKVNDPAKANDPTAPDLSAEDFASVESWASKADGATSALLGRALRGVSWFSLNNESLAQLIEGAVGATVHKLTEKVAWCAYRCQEPAAPAANRTLADVEMARDLRSLSAVESVDMVPVVVSIHGRP